MSISRRIRLLVAGSLLPLLTVSCSDPELPPPLPESEVNDIPTDQPAPKVLATAVRKLRKDDTGAFSVAIGTTRDQGRFQLSADSASLTRIVSAQGVETAFTDTIRTPGGVWVRLRTAKMSPRRTCWVRMTNALPVTSAEIPGAYAGAVGAALTAKGKRWNKDQISGSVNLVQALLAVDPTLITAVELASALDARVPASFAVSGNRMTGWSTTSAQLLGALARAGLKATGALKPLADLEGFVLDVQFTKQGNNFEVTAPQPARVISKEPADTLIKRAKACARQ
ncbi:hypothetical protein [Nocardioides daejeonensis]|uniref:hypothetical protein n=1 Tax=Nocardioides daejeonensis TaxID=1046556 RepID=UPI000D74DCFE|nr:hypothetical protein [Nocardioides daejeonensis]